MIACDRSGAVYEGKEGLDREKSAIAKVTNPEKLKGTLKDVIVGADVFLGVSAANVLTQDMVRTWPRML